MAHTHERQRAGQQEQTSQDQASSVSRVLLSELRVYESHLAAKQQRLVDQFEATAAESRAGVVHEEAERIRREHAPMDDGRLSEYMRSFEANLDREIEAQRSQLLATLTANRAAKVDAYRQELAHKLEAFDGAQAETTGAEAHASRRENPAASFAPAQPAQEQQHQQQMAAHAEEQRQRQADLHATSVASEQSMRDSLERQRLAAQETERLEKVAHEARLKQAEQERKARTEAAMPTLAHRYELQASSAKATVTRVSETPSASPAGSPLPSFSSAAPSSSLIPLHIPAASPPQATTMPMPAYQPSLQAATVMAPLQDPEAELRRRWQMLQQELHQKPDSSPAHVWQPRPASSPAASPLPATSSMSHLQAVGASPLRAGRAPEDNTRHTFEKLESALEMDLEQAWEELSTNPPPHQQPTQHRAHPSPAIPRGPPATAYPRPPAPTPMTEKMSKAVVLSSHSSVASPPRALAQPAQLLQQASGLFKTTLHDLEEKAEYLNRLISAFRDAEKEMDEKVNQQQPHQHTQYEDDAAEYAPDPSYEYGSSEVDHQAYEEDPYELQHEAAAAAQAARRRTGEPQSHHQPPQPRAASATNRARSSSVGPTSRPRVAFAPAQVAPAPASSVHRPRSATHAGTAAAAAPRTASLTRQASYPPVRKPTAAPSSASLRKPAPISRASMSRSASFAPGASIPRPTSAYNRPSLSGAPAALSYPRPRTASAKAALGGNPRASAKSAGVASHGVRLARDRIRAIVDKTRVKPVGISVLQHPKPSQSFTRDAFAKGGMRQATVQEVLVGATEIEQRKHMTPTERKAAEQARYDHLKRNRNPAGGDEYEFVESTPDHPHGPLSMVRVAREQREASERLTHHASGQLPVSSPPSYSPGGVDDSLNGSLGLNTTEGLIQQHESANQQYDGQLEQYLRAVQHGTQEERHQALARLAAKAAQQQATPLIYASPLRTHPSQRPKPQQETFSRRSDAIIRGSHANYAPTTPAVHGPSAMQTLQGIIQQHQR